MNSILSRLGGARIATGGGGPSDTNYSATGDLPRPLDAKAFSKLYRRMDRVVKSLQNSRMNLSRSPPCMIDTLPDIYVKLKEINTYYELPDRKHLLEQIDFFYITVNNIFDKCKRVNQLFKVNKDDIYVDSSESRKQLVNLTIVIAYIYADLKALFPEAQFDPHFRIAKEEAERWWKEMFHDQIIVPWAEFREKCSYAFPPLSKLELSNLKSTIDLTCNDHVSIFEFDVFTRLFAPWSMLMKNFKKLTFHPGYMASATFENVKTILNRHKEKPGSYVFRMSCTKLGFWSIGYVTDHSEQRRDAISQIVVRDGKPIVEALVEGSQKGFYLYPNGDPTNPDLSELLHIRPKPQFQVTEAQFEEYSLIGSTYQECKICNQRDKDVRLDLCGHFLCSKCLSQWLSKGTGCPFCRCEIRSTQSIVMQPFQSPSNRKHSNSVSESSPRKELFSEDSLSRPPPSHPPPPLPPGFSDHSPSLEQPQPNIVPSLTTPPRRKNSSPFPTPPKVPLPPTPPEPFSRPTPQLATSPSGSVNMNEDQSQQTGNRVRTTSNQRSSVGIVSPIPSQSTPAAVPNPSPTGSGGMYINIGASRPLPNSLSIQCDQEDAKPPTSESSQRLSDSLGASSPGSASSATRSPGGEVFVGPPMRSMDSEKRELEKLPPPPPPPLSAAVSPTRPVPAPRRHPTHAQQARSPCGTERETGRSDVDAALSSLPPPPPPPMPDASRNGSEYHQPRNELYHTPSDPYSTPVDPYNTPVDPYNAPADPYNTPVDPYNTPVDPYNTPVDPYNIPSDSVYVIPRDPDNINSDPYNIPRENNCTENEEILLNRVSARAASEIRETIRNDGQQMLRAHEPSV